MCVPTIYFHMYVIDTTPQITGEDNLKSDKSANNDKIVITQCDCHNKKGVKATKIKWKDN